MDFIKDRLNCLKCHHRHPDNGNCTAVGGFCTAVPAAYCHLIPELLARAEKAEARAGKLEKDLSDRTAKADFYENLTHEYRDDILQKVWDQMGALEEKLEAEEARAEKAEKERDAAAELIGWIYYEACVSVEHDMRQHLDWLKAKIEEWRSQKEG